MYLLWWLNGITHMWRTLQAASTNGSQVAQTVKNLPAIQEVQIQSLGGEDTPTGVGQPTAVFLPGESPWTEDPGGLQFTGSQRVGHDRATKHSTHQVEERKNMAPVLFFLFIPALPQSRLCSLTVHIRTAQFGQLGWGKKRWESRANAESCISSMIQSFLCHP